MSIRSLILPLTLLLSLLMVTCTLFAQRDSNHLSEAKRVDSTFIGREIKKNVLRMVFSFDNNQSLIKQPSYGMNGIRLGLELNEQFRFGFEINGLRDSLLQELERPFIPERNLDFGMLSLFGEYVIYRDFRCELAAPISAGVGSAQYEYLSGQGDVVFRETVNNVVMYTGGLSGHYKVIPWFGVGAGIGYRQLVTPDKYVRQTLSSPYYTIKLKLFFGYFLKSIFNAPAIRAERDEYRTAKAMGRAARHGLLLVPSMP